MINTPFYQGFFDTCKKTKNWQRWYNSEKLFHESQKQEAEIFCITTNRSSGKTTHINRFAVQNFLDNGVKFGCLVRFDYMVDYFDGKFFGDIGELFFPEHKMTMKKRLRGKWGDLYLDDKLCGHVMPISSADTLKNYSHMLNDIGLLLFDEFQSETNHYCDNEFAKIRSIHDSLARGHGKVTSYLPLICMSNNVSIINPIYTGFGITDKLQDTTKFLRVNGVLVQNSLNVYASEEQKKSTFNRSCDMNDIYSKYSYDNKFLKDINSFIEKPTGVGYYEATLKLDGNFYGLYDHLDFFYVSDKADLDNKRTIADSYLYHDSKTIINANGLSSYKYMLRDYFNEGKLRFKNQRCKSAILKYIGYT